MRKLIILIFAALAFPVLAQYETQLITVTSATASNGQTKYATLPLLLNDWVYAIQVNFDEIVAGASGTITFEASVDGTDYIAMDDTAADITADNIGNIWVDQTGTPYKYLRAKLVEAGGSSGTSKIVVYAYLKPKNGFVPSKALVYTASTDTITDSDSDQATFTMPLTHRWQYAIQCDFDELSGAATAAITVQGSNDNVYWDTAETATSGITADATYIYTDTDGTPYKYIRVNVTQTGTATSRTYVTMILKPKY